MVDTLLQILLYVIAYNNVLIGDMNVMINRR